MKKLLLIISCVFLTQLGFAATTKLDFIAAKVNNQVITYSQVKQRSYLVASQLKAEKVKLPSQKQFLHQILQTMINEKLQLEMANRAGISATNAEVQHAIADIAAQQKLSVKQLIAAINKQGISYANYVKQLQTQVTIQKLQQALVVSRVTISPAEVNTYLRSAMGGNQTSYLYHIEDILVGVSDTPSPTELQVAKQKANDILMQLKAGSNFRTLAVAESTGSQALHGGDLGWRSLAELPSVFASHVAHLKQGDLVGPIQTPNGYHILHVIGIKRNPKIPSENELKNRISQMLFRQKVEEQIQVWIQQLRAQSYVKIYL